MFFTSLENKRPRQTQKRLAKRFFKKNALSIELRSMSDAFCRSKMHIAAILVFGLATASALAAIVSRRLATRCQTTAFERGSQAPQARILSKLYYEGGRIGG